MTFSGGRWNRERSTPVQFHARVALIGGLGLIVFAVIFFRLWYLQVLSSDRYLAEAQGNRVREITVQAPRGEVRDRDGKVLIGNRTAQALQVRAEELPEDAERRSQVLRRVAAVAGLEIKKVRKEIRRQTKELPSSPVTLKRDVPIELVYYLRENQRRFPGVTVDRVYVRQYPRGSLAAHIFGYVREVNAEQLEETRYQDLLPGDEIGQDGIELAYDHILRGVNGATTVQVDASGLPTGRTANVREPEPGNDLVLTIDSDVQAVGEAQLASFGLPGAFVAMDVESGDVLAMGSSPTFDPSILAQPEITQAESESVFGDPDDDSSTGAPAFNRAIAAGYPTGSTFKPFTALAALDAGKLTPSETINDDGAYALGDGNVLRNAQDAVFGPIQLRRAMQVSSDVFFYTLGGRLAEDISEDDEEHIQDWASQLGLGDTTGIDIPGEAPGLIPTPEWRNDLYRQGLTDRPWSFGDNVNLAVGQGDLQADPVQMAVAYAAIGNGGTVVTPHVAKRAEDPAGRVVQEIEPGARREIDIDPEGRKAIMDGLTAAAMEPEGTSYPVFGEPGFPIDVAGKTGTAERPPNPDQSWYVALAPADDPKVVVAFTFEGGGFGAETAAPATRAVLTEYAEQYLSVEKRQFDEAQAESAGEAGTVVLE
jgi:penicillin-binding protein 2